MRRFVSRMTLVVFLTMTVVSNGSAQQSARRPVVYTFQQASVVKTQWAPESAKFGSSTSTDTVSANAAARPSSTTPNLLPASNSVFHSSPSNGGQSNPTQTEMNHPGFRPTVQQVQNPSGFQNFSVAGMSQGGYRTSNHYWGPQYNQWNNLHVQSTNLDSSQTFNRTQPTFYPADAGAYVSSNNYFGPTFSQWNNLSSGTAVPNYLGGYIYQP